MSDKERVFAIGRRGIWVVYFLIAAIMVAGVYLDRIIGNGGAKVCLWPFTQP